MTPRSCSKCGHIMTLTNDKHGLVKWTGDNTSGIQIHADQILPVQSFVCSQCGSIELQYAKPQSLHHALSRSL